ncbi:nucleotidyltransferase [Lactobacillus sp. LC28-10]|uniref:Nucleotidyltransferase n=1 Tax=Secundilactobacillus angelensis TaxID=2722706 RepID=A0ABX1L100_9LACO|nr:nucleotidyltransferase [Secundilactobacillus angelensis]MCH5462742.1 nucleotidyltransferase [Secundilactobacillus angelensis]NLR19104.1 nucleotidyltransferase [Secundilactobacillus angelensis]
MVDNDTEFRSFISRISETDDEKKNFDTTISEINNVINDHYYDESNDTHVLKVGSAGRNTNISATSDHDVLCVLPAGVKEQFNNRQHGQTDLLQQIKTLLQERYSRTDIRGDGQVVVIALNKGTIELVPGFKRSDGQYDYPDTHDGGSWQQTNPDNQISQANCDNINSSGKYTEVAKAIRAWRDHVGVPLKGIVIDSILDMCYKNEPSLLMDSHYISHLKAFFGTAASMKNGRIIALGTNEEMDNEDLRFIEYSKNALAAIEGDEEGSRELMIQLFGTQYDPERRATDEQYVEEKFNLKITYQLKLDAKILQNGFRPFYLQSFLARKHLLKVNRKIHFFIADSNIPESIKSNVKYYWKVRNTGEAAKGRERGMIVKGEETQDERSDFNGDHYVECYAVRRGVVIARGHIRVPIDSYRGTDEGVL